MLVSLWLVGIHMFMKYDSQPISQLLLCMKDTIKKKFVASLVTG